MDTIIKTALVVAFVVVALLLPISNDGMLTRTMMNGERMGIGSAGVIGWMLLPNLFVFLLDVLLLSVTFGKKHGQQPDRRKSWQRSPPWMCFLCSR